jgi:carboxypeptidase PM20D1
MKRALGLAVLALALVAAIMVVRALSLESRQIEVPPAETLEVDEQAAAARFAETLKFRTISYQDPRDFDGAPFRGLHAYLERTYPRVHRTLDREVVADYSLLYRWQGGDRSLEPILLMSHLDVVPVEPDTEESWTHPPFGGVVADGYVWGRGALDNKASTTAPLEAIEALLAGGFAPRRTIYLAFRERSRSSPCSRSAACGSPIPSTRVWPSSRASRPASRRRRRSSASQRRDPSRCA